LGRATHSLGEGAASRPDIVRGDGAAWGELRQNEHFATGAHRADLDQIEFPST
jgi:hypothetical protein